MRLPFLYMSGLVAITLATAQPAASDTIVLKSGDVLHGTLIVEDNTTHVIRLPYAGDISLQKHNIVSVTRSDAPTNQQDALTATAEAIQPHVTIDPPAPAKIEYGETYHYKSRVAAAGSVADGNTNNKTLHLEGEVEARNKLNRYTGKADYRFGESEGVENEDNYGASLQYDRFLSERWYAYGRAAYLHDDFQNLDHRYTFGTGLGHQIYDEPTRSLSIEAGPNYVHEDFTDGGSEDFIAGRWAVDYEEHITPERLIFFHSHEGLVNLDDTADVLIRSKTGFYVPVTDKWEARVQLNNEWDNVPASGREKFDSTYLFGAGYRW